MESKGMRVETTWTPIKGTLDYINELGWKCKYKYTHMSGYPVYNTYDAKGKFRSVGGKPSFIIA